jgi:hypothetical protein
MASDYYLEKDKQNVYHFERRLAETPILRGQVVKLGSADFLVVPATLNSQNLGVALNTVTAQDIADCATEERCDTAKIEVQVAMIGVVPVLAGAELDADDFVKSDTNGRIIESNAGATDNVIGKVLKDASGNGQETHMLIVYGAPCGRGQG